MSPSLLNAHFDQFRMSRLVGIFVEGRYVHRGVDHSDLATYWTLLGRWGVGLDRIAGEGSSPPGVGRNNETRFRVSFQSIHDELLRRSKAASGLAK